MGGVLCDICELKESDCMRGSSLNATSCKCEINCPFGLTGAKCDKCNMSTALARCTHATEATTVDEVTCRCKQCESGWGGATCNKCLTPPTFCGVGGELDTKTCTCKCKGQWTHTPEGSCTLCNISKCMHGGHLNSRTCSCKCSNNWHGKFCNVCGLQNSACAKFNTTLD